MSSKNLTKTVTNMVNKILSNNNVTNTRKRSNKNRKRRATRQTRRNVYSPQPTRGILAGYGSAVTSSFKMNRSADSCIVTGFDLVQYAADVNYISYFVPVNPIGWAGTRVAAIASAYQNYRPLAIKIHYRPQVGSTDTKSLFIGTLWQRNTINTIASIEPSLLTSAGGTYVPSWQSVSTVVPCGNKLPQNMYPIRDPTSEVVPFYIIARSSTGGSSTAATQMPGRIFIEYTFQFHNAVGVASDYSNWTTTTNSLGTQTSAANAALNTGIVVDTSDPTSLPIGSLLSWDRTVDSAGAEFYYPKVNGNPRQIGSITHTVGRFGTTNY